MAEDLFTELNWCRYCSRPGVVVWDRDIRTCTSEVCEGLAFAEVRRRNRLRHAGDEAWPLVAALLGSVGTLERALRLDTGAQLLGETDAAEIREQERERTAALIAQVRRASPRPASKPVAPSRPPRRTRRRESPAARPAQRRAAQPARGRGSS